MLALVAVVLISLLTIPATGAAAYASPVTASGTPRFVGDLAVATGDGALILAQGDSVFGPFVGSAGRVHVRHAVVWTNGSSEQRLVDPFTAGRVVPVTEPHQAHANFTSAAVRIEPQEGPYDLYVRVRDAAGALRADFGVAEIPSLPHLYKPFVYNRATANADAPGYAFADTIPDGALALLRNDPDFQDTFSSPIASVPIEARGTVLMFLMGPRVFVDGAEGSFEATTGEHRRQVQAGAPYEERRLEFVVLEMEGASLAGTSNGGSFRLLASEATFELEGTMDLAGVTGTLRPESGPRRLAGESVTVEGTLAATVSLSHGFEVEQPGDPIVPVSSNDAVVTSRTAVDGEYRLATLNGQAVASATPGLTTAEKTAVGVGLGALLLGALVAAKKFLLPALGLFARPEPLHPMLENPLRMRLHGLVNAYPGIHGRRLQGLAQIATGTFEHHMRSLLQASLVREERIGGRVVYVPCEPDGPRLKVDKDELAIRALLMTEARRRVAEAIAQGPKTQRELVEGLQLPQQTVSFHVKALLDHKVISASDGRPATYSVNPEYVDLISGASSLGEQQGILGRVLQRVRGSPPAEASAAS